MRESLEQTLDHLLSFFMKYLSTRGHPDRKQFCEILLEGLAPDGGLYLPEHYPQIDAAGLDRLRSTLATQGYAGLAFEILSLFIDDIPADDLRALVVRVLQGRGRIPRARLLEREEPGGEHLRPGRRPDGLRRLRPGAPHDGRAEAGGDQNAQVDCELQAA